MYVKSAKALQHFKMQNDRSDLLRLWQVISEEVRLSQLRPIWLSTSHTHTHTHTHTADS